MDDAMRVNTISARPIPRTPAVSRRIHIARHSGSTSESPNTLDNV